MGSVDAKWVFVIWAVLACSRMEHHEAAASVSQALTSDAAQVFGFESAADWTVSNGSAQVAASADHSQGTRSLSVGNFSYLELRSRQLSSIGSIASQATLDILLPSPQPNPYWYGTASLVVDCPSKGIYSASLAQVSLNGLPLQSFQKLTFSIPSNVQAVISGGLGAYADLTLKVVLNVPSSSGTYLVDNLSLGGTVTTPSTPPSTCTLGGRCAIALNLPAQLPDAESALVANDAVSLGDRTKVLAANQAPGTVVSLGSQRSTLGTEVRTGDVWSMGQLELRDRASALVAHTPFPVILGAGATVSSENHDPHQFDPYRLKAWSFGVPATPGTALDLQPDQTSSLSPGGYTNVAVKSRSTLKLSAGSYFFKSLTLEPQAKLDISQAGGAVYIYVLESLTYRGGIVGATSSSLLVGYLGTATLNLEAPFVGTLVAPKAKLSFSSISPATYQGAFHAKSIETQPGVVITLGPSLVHSLGSSDRAQCMDGFNISYAADASPAGRQAAYEALLNCVAPGIPACQAAITSTANVDRRAAAVQYMAKTFSSSAYLALARDRTRKVNEARLETARANAYCAGDDDGDLVGNSIDACPGTPPLTPTDDTGCPTNVETVAPPREIIDSLLTASGIFRDPRCDGFGAPTTPVPRELYWSVQHDPNVLSIQLQTGGLAPNGCDEWFEVVIEDPMAPPEHAVSRLVLKSSEVVQHSDGYSLWTISSAEAGARGAIAAFFVGYAARSIHRHDVYIRARVTTGNGRQSAWAGPYRVLAFTAAS